LKIGVGAHIFWSSKNSDLIKTIYHIFEDLNFKNVEIACEHPFFKNWGTERADKLKKEVREAKDSLDIEISLHAPYHDINIASWNLAMRGAAIKQVKECVEMADYLNSKVVVVHPGFKSSRKFSKKKTFEMMVQNFNKILKLAEDLDVTLCLENMASKPKAMCIYPDELIKIFEDINSEHFRLTLDVAHANTTGIDPADFAEKLRGYVHHLHISDNQGKDNHLPVGLGTIDFEEFFKSLGSFKGSSIIEGWAPQNTDRFVIWTKEELQQAWSAAHK
jgi:sugar phosphate isomerase/epimerase